MQCKGYVLDALMSRELNMDAGGSTCPPCRTDTAFENEYYRNGFIQPQYLFYGKDLIKQTMLKQEAILMNQVAELHRLYKIQTVKMDEFRSRKQLGGDYTKVENSIHNPFRSEIPLDNNPQEMLNIPRMPFSSSSFTLSDIIQPPFSYIEGMNFQTFKKLVDSKGKKKMLDLSLPANDSEYIKCEEIELFEKEIVCNAHEALKFPENKDPDVVLPLNHCGEVEHFCTGDVLTAPEPSSSRLATLFDLNEPFQPNEVDIPGASFQGLFSNSHTRHNLDDSSKNLDKENQVKLPTSNCESGKPRSSMNLFGSEILTMSLKSSHHETNEALELPVSLYLNQSKASWDENKNCSLETSDRKHRLLENKSMKKFKPPKIPKLHEIIPYHPNPKSSVVTMRKYGKNVERRPIVIQALPCFIRLGPVKSSKQSNLHKKKKCKSSWDFITPGGLEGPISPENEESFRPRGDSTEKEIETVANGHLSKQEAKLAAEAIVSISSSKVQACQKSGNHSSSALGNADSLYLFAGVASSSSKDGLPSNFSGKNGDQELDYFEIMTLEIPETKVGESLFIDKDYKEENVEASLMQKTIRKGHASIGKQLKNFQMELLPSIASLSRQEMKEDFQAIENLRAVTSVSKKEKESARRRRKTSKTTGINLVNKLKQLEKMCETGILEEGLLPGWGKVPRRRRRPRFAATNPGPIVVAQV